jgi:hypothetical protein
MSILAAAIGGAVSLFGASKAAKAQEQAAREQVELARETRDMTRADLAPYTQAGTPAVNALMFELGLGPRPTFGGDQGPVTQNTFDSQRYLSENEDVARGWGGSAWDHYQKFGKGEGREAFSTAPVQPESEWQGLSMTPASNFLLQQGRNTIEAGAAGSGGLYSGATLQGLEDYRQNVALGDRENQMNRLFQVAGIGQAGAAGTAAANQNYATMGGNALANMGNAQAAGYIGSANAINNTIGNITGYQQYNRLMQGFGQATPGAGGLY